MSALRCGPPRPAADLPVHLLLTLSLLAAAGCDSDVGADAGVMVGAGGADAVADRLVEVRDGRGRPPIRFDGGLVDPVVDPPQPSLRIGVPDGDTPTAAEFLVLEPGGDIPLETFGQGATHGVFMVEVVGLGPRTWIDLTMRNLDAGSGVDAGLPGQVSSIDGGEPEPLTCSGEGAESRCLRGPFIVLTTGLAEPEEMDGLHIAVSAIAVNAAGEMAAGGTDGYLRQQF